eukprot:13343023-Alexandrium_andersonii.AAC.1
MGRSPQARPSPAVPRPAWASPHPSNCSRPPAMRKRAVPRPQPAWARPAGHRALEAARRP